MFLAPTTESSKLWKETILSLLIAILCYLLVYFFPADGYLQNLTKNVFFLLLIPFFFIRLVLQKDIRDFGINWGNKKTGLWGGILLIIFLAILFFLIIRYTEFSQVYIPPTLAKTNFAFFLFYELVLINLFLIPQEVFFKGFLISALHEKLGYWAVLIQSIVFIFPLFVYSSYFFQVLPMITLSFFGGLLAYKSRTFVYSYLASIIFLILLDSYIIFINK